MASLGLIEGVRVLDLAGGAGSMAGRILADLGATVLRVDDPVSGDADLRSHPTSTSFWSYRKRVVDLDDAGAVDIVLAGRRTPRDMEDRFGDATWVWVTPYGLTGPRAGWRGSELTCIASSGNLFPTGYPDRPPIACSQPTAFAHGGADAVIGALFSLAVASRPAVDLSVQEAAVGANLGAHTTLYRHRMRGERVGPFAGGTREVWPCLDGHVSFAVRGGPARAKTWVGLRQLLVEHGFDVTPLPTGDARSFDTALASAEEIDAISRLVARFFAANTKSDLHRWARERSIMLAPILGPSEILVHPQLEHRGFFEMDGSIGRVAGAPFVVHEPPRHAAPASTRDAARLAHVRGEHIWSGLRILELGSAFAGPLASRYFVEHGADCLHIESARQPDAARHAASMPIDPSHPFLERSPLFPAINVNKRSVLIDLKTSDGRALARRLALEWADVLVENYSPRVLEGWGLGYSALAAERPDLVYASSTMWGHDGPFANEKGFGGIGQAQSGHVYLTGYADRDPVFPFGLITDSLTPKLTAGAIAAALWRRRRTGAGCHIDVSQIQAAAYTLGPWLLRESTTGDAPARSGNDFGSGAVCHGVFACRGDERWIAIVAASPDEAARLADELGIATDSVTSREVVEAATSGRDANELACALQAADVEAYVVADLVEVCSDPQLVERGHFFDAEHPVHDTLLLERGASRIAGYPGAELRAGPLFGSGTREALHDALGLSDREIDALERDEVLQ